MDADQFTGLYIAVITRAMPDATVQRNGELRLTLQSATGQEAQIFLANPFADYRRDPEALQDILVTHIRSMMQSIADHAQDGGATHLDQVLPLLRRRDWVEDRARQIRQAGGGPGSETYHEPFTGPLAIVYGIDRPETIRYLSTIDVERLGLSPEALRAQAIRNLADRLPTYEIGTFQGGNAGTLSVDADLEPSLLLFDQVWSQQALQFGGDVVVAVPARGMLLVTGSDNAVGLAQVRELARVLFADDEYPLSDVLLVRRAGRFQAFE